MGNELFTIFAGFPVSKLKEYKNRYQFLIAQQDKNYAPPINKKTGKPLGVPKMPWMVPVWEKGLNLVTAEIEQAQKK